MTLRAAIVGVVLGLALGCGNSANCPPKCQRPGNRCECPEDFVNCNASNCTGCCLFGGGCDTSPAAVAECGQHDAGP